MIADVQKIDEPRLITEEGLAAKVAALAEPVASSLGFRLVRVRQSGPTLQIMAEREDGSFSIEDCEALSRALSPVLDAEDVVSASYNLEISSPGIDRPLVRCSDFKRAAGHEAKIEFSQVLNNRRRARGVIVHAGESGFSLKIEGEVENLEVPFGAVAEAKLVLSDKLLAEARERAKTNLSDGAAYDPAQHEDISISEDRRNFHGCR